LKIIIDPLIKFLNQTTELCEIMAFFVMTSEGVNEHYCILIVKYVYIYIKLYKYGFKKSY